MRLSADQTTAVVGGTLVSPGGAARGDVLIEDGRIAAVIERHWDGVAAYCRPENKVPLGFVEGLNNKIRVIQRRAYGLRNEDYLRLKILTCMLPEL